MKFRLKGDKSLWALTFIFALVSLIFVYSSSSREAYLKHTTTFSLMLKQMRFILLGLVAIFGCHLIPLGWYRKLAYLGYAGGLGLLLLTMLMGQTINDGTRWLQVGGFSLQSSEFAKVLLVLFVAKILETVKFDTFKQFLLKFMLPVGVYIVLILWEGFSTGALIAFTVFVMLTISDVRFKYTASAMGIAVGLVIILLGVNHFVPLGARFETVEARMANFFDNSQDNVENDQEVYSKMAIATGGVRGKLPGNGTLRHVLPHPNRDYIYSIIVEETGLIGGVAVLMMYLWLLYSAVVISRDCKRTFSSMLVMGLGILIITQAMIHILVNVGIFPVTGQSLPLISLGGSSILAISIAIGMMLSVSRAVQDDKLYTLEP